jgi:hypothetical protein
MKRYVMITISEEDRVEFLHPYTSANVIRKLIRKSINSNEVYIQNKNYKIVNRVTPRGVYPKMLLLEVSVKERRPIKSPGKYKLPIRTFQIEAKDANGEWYIRAKAFKGTIRTLRRHIKNMESIGWELRVTEL